MARYVGIGGSGVYEIHGRSQQCNRSTMETTLASHQSTCSIQDSVNRTCVQSSQYRYPTLLGSFAYMKVVLQSNTDITKCKHSECTCSW